VTAITEAMIERGARAINESLCVLGDESPLAAYNLDGYRIWLTSAARAALVAAAEVREGG
jgi:hypothetical protein